MVELVHEDVLLLVGLGEILSKVHDWTRELVVPHHPVQGGHQAAGAHRVHPVGVHELDPRQAYRLDGPINLLDRSVIVLSGYSYLTGYYGLVPSTTDTIVFLLLCIMSYSLDHRKE